MKSKNKNVYIHYTYAVENESIGIALDFIISANGIEFKTVINHQKQQSNIPISQAHPINSTKVNIYDVLNGKYGKIKNILPRKKTNSKLHILIVVKKL